MSIKELILWKSWVTALHGWHTDRDLSQNYIIGMLQIIKKWEQVKREISKALEFKKI